MRACWHNEQIKKDISDCVLTRVLYDNLVSLVYDTYTSHVKFTVQVTEGLEERLIASGSLPTSDQFRTLLDNDYWHNQILLTLNKFYLLPYDVVPLKWMLSSEWFSERYLYIHYWKQDVFNIRIEMLIYCAPDPDSRLEKSLLDPGIMSLS